MQGCEEAAGGVEALSGDLWLAVFARLDVRDLCTAAQTCRMWRSLAASDQLWRPQWMAHHAGARWTRLSSNEMGGCAIRIASEPESQASRAQELLMRRPKQARKAQARNGSPPHTSGDTAANRATQAEQRDSYWLELFKRSQDVQRNWATGRCTAELLEGHNDFIRCLQLSGDTLVSCSGSISHNDISIRVWDVQAGECRQVLRGHMGPIWCMMYEPTLKRIATGSDDYTVRYWDSVTGNSVVMQDPDSAVRCIHMDPCSRQLVAGTEFGRLLLWDMDQLEDVLSHAVDRVVAEFERRALEEQAAGAMGQGGHGPGGPGPGGGRGSTRQERTPLHRRVPSAGRTGGRGAGRAVAAMGLPGPIGLTAEALLDGRHVVADASNHVRVVDAAEEGKAISAIQVQGGLCASTSIEPLSRIQLWDVSRNSWQPAGTLGEPDMMYANSLSFDKGVGVLVAGCGDRHVRVWDLATGGRTHLLRGHTEEIHAHQFDARTLASAALDGQIRLWDMRSGECVHVLQHSAPTHAFQYNDHHLVSGTWDGHVCLWDMRRGELVREWAAHNERVWAVALDEYHVASAGLDHLVCVRSFVPPALNPALQPGDSMSMETAAEPGGMSSPPGALHAGSGEEGSGGLGLGDAEDLLGSGSGGDVSSDTVRGAAAPGLGGMQVDGDLTGEDESGGAAERGLSPPARVTLGGPGEAEGDGTPGGLISEWSTGLVGCARTSSSGSALVDGDGGASSSLARSPSRSDSSPCSMQL